MIVCLMIEEAEGVSLQETMITIQSKNPQNTQIDRILMNIDDKGYDHCIVEQPSIDYGEPSYSWRYRERHLHCIYQRECSSH